MLGDPIGSCGYASQMSMENALAQQQGYFNDPLTQQLSATQQRATFDIYASYQCQRGLYDEPSTIDKMQSDVTLWLNDWDK